MAAKLVEDHGSFQIHEFVVKDSIFPEDIDNILGVMGFSNLNQVKNADELVCVHLLTQVLCIPSFITEPHHTDLGDLKIYSKALCGFLTPVQLERFKELLIDEFEVINDGNVEDYMAL